MIARLLTHCFVVFLTAAVAAGQVSTTGTGRAKDAAAEVMLIDGESFRAKLVGVGKSDAVFRTARGLRKAPVRDLWRIRFAEPGRLMSRPGSNVILLAGGGMLGIESFEIAGGKIAAESKLLGKTTIELSSAGTIYLPGRGRRPENVKKRLDQMNLRRSKQDYLIAEDNKGNWIPVPGILKTVKSGRATFRFEQADRIIDLTLVRAIRLARLERKTSPLKGRLVGRDGSVVPFTSVGFVGTKLSVTADGIKADPVDLSAVAEIRFLSDRFVYLSDLKASKVVQAGLFDMVFPFRRDRSSAGGPLRIGKRTYPKGLGMHSRCELTYDIGGKFATFAAVVGIDKAAANRGDAALKILGDGRELLKPLRLTGNAEGVSIRCDVAGVKKLTILADFGADGIDVGDHVDIAEARLIKK